MIVNLTSGAVASSLQRGLSGPAYWGLCAAAVLGLLLMKQTPPDFAAGLLAGRMLSIHLLLELVAIVIAGLVVTISWHQFGQRKGLVTPALLAGFIVVMGCDLMHALSYKGMPDFLSPSSTSRAIFFWLMGRSFEVLTLLVIALGLLTRVPHGLALSAGLGMTLAVLLFGSYGLEFFPVTYVEGLGVTAFKARYEYLLCAGNIGLSLLLRRRAVREHKPHFSMLALSAFLMGVGELAFTAYTAPSDFQNIFGHLYKVIAYVLLYRATFITSMMVPFEALRESEAQLRESQVRIQTLSANLPQAVIYQVLREADGSKRFSQVSAAIGRVNGLDAQAVLRDSRLWYEQVLEEDRPLMQAAEARSAQTLQVFDVELRLRRADGALRRMHFVSAPRLLEDGRMVWDGIETDVTERRDIEDSRRLLETQLREAQKMESIGTLASGIAHDFNNVLGAIVGNAGMARDDLERGARGEARQALDQLLLAAQRARELVRQILTFGRRQPSERVVQPLAPLIAEAASLLRATLPANVELLTQVKERELLACVDRGQIGQVLMNLCMNAWQAMGPQGGRIELGLERRMLDAGPALAAGLLAGSYVHLWVSDNGSGMDEATRQRVFEPFFTTKPLGKGTGLGLAVVHGIVQSHEGSIVLDSRPGEGTRFDIYLPPATSEAERVAADADLGAGLGGRPGRGERVLYLDDDEIVSMMVERLLARAGYAVTCCRDPREAVALLGAQPPAFEVLVSDYNMPHLSGLDVIERARAQHPTMAVVLVTGSATEDLLSSCAEQGVTEVLEKQFLFEQLAPGIARALLTV